MQIVFTCDARCCHSSTHHLSRHEVDLCIVGRLHAPLDPQHLSHCVLVSMADFKLFPGLPEIAISLQKKSALLAEIFVVKATNNNLFLNFQKDHAGFTSLNWVEDIEQGSKTWWGLVSVNLATVLGKISPLYGMDLPKNDLWAPSTGIAWRQDGRNRSPSIALREI